MKTVFICLVLCTGSIFSAPCKPDDSKCLTELFQAALPKIVAGIPALGIESTDPLYMDVIESLQPMLTTNYTNVKVDGYEKCKLKEVKLNPQKSTMMIETFCSLFMSGDYTIKGRLLVIPIEGDGQFTIDAKKLLLAVEADTKLVDGSNGKKYMNIKNFKLTVDPVDTVKFNFTNLFNGNKQLGDGVLKFANDNYRDVTREVGPPFLNANLKRIFKNFNKYMKTTPIDQLLILQ